MSHAPPLRLQIHERLHIVPETLRTARAYVRVHHRHLDAPAGGMLAIGVKDGSGRLRGVAILGRPVARRLDDELTIEITRVATDGCANACSALYGAARRIARALGYLRIITYTREEESGTSLRAAGWTPARRTRGGSWSRTDRPRLAGGCEGPKRRWSIDLARPVLRLA
jgi:hypothetical protein